ncbi:Putative O-methyltransferase [Corynebacterium occultum]|uniref:O-methyltransferase n=1 Tax=Corynebacterium occultum TaxID=2675219 RepID=A0A6B8VNB8_9CORY|nr:Putative O-methyltransferase [Corynebacterium occultum]
MSLGVQLDSGSFYEVFIPNLSFHTSHNRDFWGEPLLTALPTLARLLIVTDTAFDALLTYIESTIPGDEVLDAARRDAEEFGLTTPDEVTGQLLSTLTAAAASEKSAGAIAVTPAASVVGLYLLKGLGSNGMLTCIDPEVEHQRQAKQIFRAAGFSPSRVRFLPSRPLDVMGRLAHGSYQLVYGEVSPLDLNALVKTAWPLLSPGGVLVLPDVLLDGTLADESRKDRATVAVREALEYVDTLEDALITRLPLGAGMMLISRRP